MRSLDGANLNEYTSIQLYPYQSGHEVAGRLVRHCAVIEVKLLEGGGDYCQMCCF